MQIGRRSTVPISVVQQSMCQIGRYSVVSHSAGFKSNSYSSIQIFQIRRQTITQTPGWQHPNCELTQLITNAGWADMPQFQS